MDLKTTEAAAKAAFHNAMIARDAIDNCHSPEWSAAHQIAKAASIEWKRATQAVYDAGLEHAPYWWVR